MNKIEDAKRHLDLFFEEIEKTPEDFNLRPMFAQIFNCMAYIIESYDSLAESKNEVETK